MKKGPFVLPLCCSERNQCITIFWFSIFFMLQDTCSTLPPFPTFKKLSFQAVWDLEDFGFESFYSA